MRRPGLDLLSRAAQGRAAGRRQRARRDGRGPGVGAPPPRPPARLLGPSGPTAASSLTAQSWVSSRPGAVTANG